MKVRREQLVAAQRARALVRFGTRFETSFVTGYVLDVGPKLVLVSVVGHGMWFDGFQCFRIADLRDLAPEPQAKFVRAALRARGERSPRKPRVRVGGIAELLLSAARAFPLVTIHRERISHGACWIGRVLGIERGRVALREINPDATWDRGPTHYGVSEITRVDFGGDYEDALFLVGGEPPRV